MAHRARLIAFVTGLLICLSLACASIGATAPKATATRAGSTSTPTPTTVSAGEPGPTSTAADTPSPTAGTPTPATAATEAVTPTPTPSQDIGATATSFPSTQGSSGPADIPIISGSTKILTATDQQVIYNTDADVPTLIQFYKDQMPQNGWTYTGIVTTKAPPQTSITFTKAKREANVSIIDPPGAKQRLVSIVIVTH